MLSKVGSTFLFVPFLLLRRHCIIHHTVTVILLHNLSVWLSIVLFYITGIICVFFVNISMQNNRLVAKGGPGGKASPALVKFDSMPPYR